MAGGWKLFVSMAAVLLFFFFGLVWFGGLGGGDTLREDCLHNLHGFSYEMLW